MSAYACLVVFSSLVLTYLISTCVQGFYAVYSRVFSELATEERQDAADDSDESDDEEDEEEDQNEEEEVQRKNKDDKGKREQKTTGNFRYIILHNAILVLFEIF